MTDDTSDTEQALYIANQDIWISHWGGEFYQGSGVLGESDSPENEVDPSSTTAAQTETATQTEMATEMATRTGNSDPDRDGDHQYGESTGGRRLAHGNEQLRG